MKFDDYLPSEFKVEYCSQNGLKGGFRVSLSGDVIILHECGIKVIPEYLKIAKSNWEAFWKALDEVGCWEWNDLYEVCSCSGPRWMVRIEFQDHNLNSRGTNDFPDNFMEFIEALENLLDTQLNQDVY